MQYEEYLEILAEQFGCEPEDLDSATTLEELGADGEDLTELAWQLEEAFGREISPQEVGAWQSLGRIWMQLTT